MSSSRGPQSSETFIPLGSLNLRAIHKRFKDQKQTSHEERQTTVRVIWDVNTCPLRDNDNNFVYNAASLRENINSSLSHLSPNLHVEEKMFVAGDPSRLHPNDWAALNPDFIIRKCDERFFVCSLCKDTTDFTPKTTDEVFTTLQEYFLGDAIDRGSPGILLLISSDADFIPAIDFLGENGFMILLAQQIGLPSDHLNQEFRDHAHYTYIWKDLRVGKPPTYQCDFA